MADSTDRSLADSERPQASPSLSDQSISSTSTAPLFTNEELTSCTRTDPLDSSTDDSNNQQLVSSVQERLLSPKAQLRVNKLLGNHEFTKFALWQGYTLPQIKADEFGFSHAAMGTYLLEEKNVKLIGSANGQFMAYNPHGKHEGIYTPTVLSVARNIYPDLTSWERENVRLYLKDIQPSLTPTEQSSPYLVAFNNGVLDLNSNSDELQPFSPATVLLNKIPWDYKPFATSPFLDSCLTDWACGDPKLVLLLKEIAGCFFCRSNKLRKAFILYSPHRRNGKSTYIELLQYMLGEDNYCGLSLQELNNSFKRVKLANKLACFKAELPTDSIANTADAKSAISGDVLSAEHKGKDMFFFTPYAKFVFSTNDLPQLNDKSGALLDRLIIVPFTHATFETDEAFNSKFALERKAMCEALIAHGVKAYREVLRRSCFTTTKETQELTKEYNKDNNQILLFFDELGEDKAEQERALMQGTTKQQYARYKEFCKAGNYTPINDSVFGKEVYRHFPNIEKKRRRLNGELVYCFVQKIPTLPA